MLKLSVLLVGFLGFAQTSLAQSQDLDLNKVNEVLNEIASDLIKDDPFFETLSGQIDPTFTDFNGGKVAGSISAGVFGTNWDPGQKSALSAHGQFEKTGEVTRLDPYPPQGEKPQMKTYVQAEIMTGGVLSTQTVALLKYAWGVNEWCSSDPATPGHGYFTYVGAKVCAQVSSVMENLSAIGQFNDLVVELVSVSVPAYSQEFINLAEREMKQTQDEETKEFFQGQIESAEKYLNLLKTVKFEQTAEDLKVSVQYENLAVGMIVAEEFVGVNFNAPWEIEKDNFDFYWSTLQDVLQRLQEKDAEVVEDTTNFLKQYLDLVRSVAQPE